MYKLYTQKVILILIALMRLIIYNKLYSVWSLLNYTPKQKRYLRLSEIFSFEKRKVTKQTCHNKNKLTIHTNNKLIVMLAAFGHLDAVGFMPV